MALSFFFAPLATFDDFHQILIVITIEIAESFLEEAYG